MTLGRTPRQPTRRRRRSRQSAIASITWALALVIIGAAWRPGLAGQVALVTVTLVGAGVLWNLPGLRAAWREDRETKRYL